MVDGLPAPSPGEGQEVAGPRRPVHSPVLADQTATRDKREESGSHLRGNFVEPGRQSDDHDVPDDVEGSRQQPVEFRWESDQVLVGPRVRPRERSELGRDHIGRERNFFEVRARAQRKTEGIPGNLETEARYEEVPLFQPLPSFLSPAPGYPEARDPCVPLNHRQYGGHG
jgi:hypothetical protein